MQRLHPAAGLLLLGATIALHPGGAIDPGPRQAAPGLRVGRDSFVVRFAGAPEGYEIHEYTRISNGYRYVRRVEIGSLLHLRYDIQLTRSLRPTTVRSETQMNGRSGTSAMSYGDRRVRGTARSIDAIGRGPVSIDTLLPDGAFDGDALYPMLLGKPWRAGHSERLVLFDTDEMNVTVQTAQATRTEMIEAGGKAQRALRIELSTTQLPVTLWISEHAPFRLLRDSSANGVMTLVRSSHP
jgi:hypothetical protein